MILRKWSTGLKETLISFLFPSSHPLVCLLFFFFLFLVFSDSAMQTHQPNLIHRKVQPYHINPNTSKSNIILYSSILSTLLKIESNLILTLFRLKYSPFINPANWCASHRYGPYPLHNLQFQGLYHFLHPYNELFSGLASPIQCTSAHNIHIITRFPSQWQENITITSKESNNCLSIMQISSVITPM